MQERQGISTVAQGCLYETGNRLNGVMPSAMSTENKMALGEMVTAEPIPGEPIYRLGCPVEDCTAECLLTKNVGKLSFVIESADGTPPNCVDGNTLQR